MKYTLFILLFFNVAASPKIWYTHLTNHRFLPVDPLQVDPGYALPDHPENYVWKVRSIPNQLGNKETPTGVSQEVQVCEEKQPDNLCIPVKKSIPVGTVVTLDFVKKWGGSMYYSVTLPETQPYKGKTPEYWLSGHYIKAESMGANAK